MAIQQKLQTRLSQKLILTPSLQQAIKLLPMSTIELVELLNQEVVENPLLEEIPDEGPPADPAEPLDKTAESPDAPTADGQDAWEDADYEYFFGDYLDDGYRSRTPTEFKELPPIENTLSTGTSLSDHLLRQLGEQTDDARLRDIGSAIVGNLNEDGYLVASIDEIAAMGPWPPAEVERALAFVQTLDPVGIAARDLRECLLLQLGHHGLGGTPCERIVREHLHLLQHHQMPELARKLDMSIVTLKEHVEALRQLDPKPGSRLNPVQSRYVIPDVSVIKVENEYVAVLNDDRMPQLRISPVYRRMMSKASQSSEETRAYVKKKLESAKWLIKSVDQRQRTIHKVATSIIRFQRGFLDHGIEHLRPLVLRDVANDIGMHESTVSRVVTNKYMHTPQGVFEMKYFFHSGINSAYGENVSSVKVKERIRKIIAQEDARKPLSDSRIVHLLQDEGLVLARRTIAKYREELKIPTSSRRRVHY
jgi:RNA polymerase sigma-54 factor